LITNDGDVDDDGRNINGFIEKIVLVLLDECSFLSSEL
jgi:hypothetical protein